MSSVNLHNSLLRPAVLQILRAAGFNYTRNAVLDTVTDLAARYLLLLASATAQHAFNNHNDYVPTVQDVRQALLEVGAFRPQLSVLEERFKDMRGVDGFVNWARGPANKDIRRIAGLVGEAGAGEGLAVLDEEEDYVTGESDPV
jgi:transcription initiation factor TFIID subunit 3